ncbi:MAG: 3-hydroxyacyl-CoA dehydrogenase family protein [Candidatus Omnitrophica bacterium]|nr:3-hydroxyacyl-CoA dehydrogenase family protein [Candidatus Omnitrophota bacterium]
MYIYKVGVVGAGQMGSEIAQVVTYAGLPVVLKDVKEEYVQKGLERIRGIYKRRVDKGKMTSSEMDQKLALVIPSTNYDDFKDVDIVIEAVPEKMELKKQVFQDLEKVAGEGTIFATNTSALSVSEMGAATKRPEKFIGMHFFYPASVMKLIEVIPGLATGQETIEDVVNFSESLRKIPVRVNECAGFLVNRLLMPYLNEAAYCLQEGAATREELDKIVRMKPAEIWYKLYNAKYFGTKTGAGFYSYSPDKPDMLAQWIAEVQKETKKTATQSTIERLIFPMINEAALCVEENVAKPADIDMAMVAGVGFPQDKGGILKYADEIGLDHVLAVLEDLYSKHGDRFWPAPRLRRMVGAKFFGKKSGRGFFEYT